MPLTLEPLATAVTSDSARTDNAKMCVSVSNCCPLLIGKLNKPAQVTDCVCKLSVRMSRLKNPNRLSLRVRPPRCRINDLKDAHGVRCRLTIHVTRNFLDLGYQRGTRNLMSPFHHRR